MRVLVTGGTGFIGRGLVHALGKRGDDVTVVSRRAEGKAIGWDAIEREVERADAIVHLAGEPVTDARWTKARLEQLHGSRVEPTARIAHAVERASRKPKVLVSASAVGFYGMREDDEELDERAPPAGDVLARMVVAWEEAAAAARSAGVRVVHPRTGVVLGKGGGALARMVAPFKWFVGGPIGAGRQWVSWIHMQDVIRALMFVLDTEALVGPINLVAPAAVTMNVLAGAIGHALGRPSAMRVPSFALQLALGKGLAQMLLTGPRVRPQKLLDAGFVFDFPHIEQAFADLLGAVH